MSGRRASAPLALAVLIAIAPGASAAKPPPADLPATSWVLVDSGSGDVLASRAPLTPASIASATKLMTAYVALRRLRPDDRVSAPPYSAAAGESLMGLASGERVSVSDLLYGLLLASGNDAAVALAAAVAPSTSAFVARMNAAAGRLGLDSTSYADPVGLDAANRSSAADLAKLAATLMRDALFRRIVDTPRRVLRSGAEPRTVVNLNTLVIEVPWVNGVKTGHTDEAGYVLVGSGRRRGVELVSAVMGAPSEADRDAATLALLEYGATLYRRVTALAEGERVAVVPVASGDQHLPVLAAAELRVPVRADQRVSTSLDLPAEVEGPIERGQSIGTATVAVDGEAGGSVDLQAARSVAAPTLADRVDGTVPEDPVARWLLAIALAVAIGSGLLVWRSR